MYFSFSYLDRRQQYITVHLGLKCKEMCLLTPFSLSHSHTDTHSVFSGSWGPSYCSQNQQRSGHCVWGVSGGVAGFCLVRHWFSLGLGWKVAALTVTPPPAKALNVCEPVCGFLFLSLFFKWKYMKKMYFWFLRSLLRFHRFKNV